MTGLIKTPLMTDANVKYGLNCRSLSLKLETCQLWNNFKTRGVSHQVAHYWPTIANSRGVLAVSTGNYGYSLSKLCEQRGVECRILVPEDIADWKEERLEEKSEAIKEKCTLRQIAEKIETYTEQGYTFMVVDDPVCIKAYGTIVDEILEQGGCPDVIMAPVGSGSLLAGISSRVKELKLKTEVFGLEPEYCPMMFRSTRAGKLSIENSVYLGTLGPKYMCGNSFPVIYKNGVKIIQVPTELVFEAKAIMAQAGQIVDPLAAQNVAVLRHNLLPGDYSQKHIVGIITG